MYKADISELIWAPLPKPPSSRKMPRIRINMSASPRALSSHKKPRKRAVYVVPRPRRKAGPFSFLSEAKLPLCHWALLVSEQGHVDLRDRVNRLAPDTA